MLDRKYIIAHAEAVKQNCKNRNLPEQVDRLVDLENQRRDLLKEVEALNRQANDVAKTIGKAKDDAEREERKEQGRQLLADCPQQAVVVSHSPPKGIVDRSSRGHELGSQAVRETVELHRPRLLVCGHIHESAGQSETIGSTTIVNAGPQGILWMLAE